LKIQLIPVVVQDPRNEGSDPDVRFTDRRYNTSMARKKWKPRRPWHRQRWSRTGLASIHWVYLWIGGIVVAFFQQCR
jgi:hypothetical protein